MSIYLELPPEVEAQLSEHAEGKGLDLADLIREMVESNLARQEIQSLKTPEGRWDFSRLRALPTADQDRIMERAAKDAAPLYAADLALPPHERELTAFGILNEYDPVMNIRKVKAE